MFFALLLAILCLLNGAVDAAQLRVPLQFHDIQSALDAASPGDTVLVAPGIYTGPGNRDLDFRGKALSLIGSAGASATLLDCEGKGRAFRFTRSEGSDCLLRGFTVRRGAALGAGAAGKGGAVYCSGASPRIEACVFAGSEAQYGGGIGAEWDSRPRISGCLFLANRARQDGGAIYLLGGGGTLSDCTLRDNRAGQSGDDAYLSDASPLLERCRFDSAPARGAPLAP